MGEDKAKGALGRALKGLVTRNGTEDGRRADQPVDRGGYGDVKDESSWVNLGSGPLRLSFNPVVTGISLAAILGFAVWAMVMPSEAAAEFSNWKAWVGNEFTWLYIGSQDAWAVFIIIIFCSKARITNIDSSCIVELLARPRPLK